MATDIGGGLTEVGVKLVNFVRVLVGFVLFGLWFSFSEVARLNIAEVEIIRASLCFVVVIRARVS
jgi:hypothetical protein